MNRDHGLHRLKLDILKVLILIFIIFFSDIVFAGLSVDPVTVEVVAQKGVERTGVFKIKNTGMEPLMIRIQSEKWTRNDIDINNWLILDPVEFELISGMTKDVFYKIKPPEDSSGELKCMTFFVADGIGEQRSNVGIRFGVPIYAIVGGTEVIDAEIKGINVNYEEGILNGTILVNNKGNIHIRPNIEIKIFNSKDKLITGFYLPYGQPAQANQIRPFIFQQNLMLNCGKYKLFVKVDYGKLYGMSDKSTEGKAAFIVKAQIGEVIQEKIDEKGEK